jgi:hypothetical protein
MDSVNGCQPVPAGQYWQHAARKGENHYLLKVVIAAFYFIPEKVLNAR